MILYLVSFISSTLLPFLPTGVLMQTQTLEFYWLQIPLELDSNGERSVKRVLGAFSTCIYNLVLN